MQQKRSREGRILSYTVPNSTPANLVLVVQVKQQTDHFRNYFELQTL